MHARTPSDARSRRRRRGITLVTLAMLFTVVYTAIPVPFAIEHPGPWWNTLGNQTVFEECSPEPTEEGTQPLIEISGTTVYATTGALDLLTVCLEGTPEVRPNWFDVITAYFTPSQSVIPFEYVYPKDETQEERDTANAADMVDSQAEAIAAAMTYLGYSVEAGVTVRETSSGMPADGVVLPGDVIVAVNSNPLTSIDKLIEAVQSAGAGTPVDLTLDRSGQAVVVTVTPVAKEGKAFIGLIGQTAYNYPFDVTIHLNDVGGPSAGMMFALGIIDKVTPDDLTGGKKFAGTGTIDAAGTVGPIGGIREKMYSAQAAGAEFFLAPVDDCAEVIGHIPAGLQVFAVTTLHEAVNAVTTAASGKAEAIAQLPACR
ncbi:unannotated protein [freshwater metagenome]|uniref:Unannotated protein n=1 Tax=freshwater metagenome TaxID=449393 RepID=A0A6J7G2J7_9ZZZZ